MFRHSILFTLTFTLGVSPALASGLTYTTHAKIGGAVSSPLFNSIDEYLLCIDRIRKTNVSNSRAGILCETEARVVRDDQLQRTSFTNQEAKYTQNGVKVSQKLRSQ